MTVNKKSLSERDICTKYITPTLVTVGWDVQTQIREEVFFADGQIIVNGEMVKRGTAKRADYVLSYQPNLPFVFNSNGGGHLNQSPIPTRARTNYDYQDQVTHLRPVATHDRR